MCCPFVVLVKHQMCPVLFIIFFLSFCRFNGTCLFVTNIIARVKKLPPPVGHAIIHLLHNNIKRVETRPVRIIYFRMYKRGIILGASVIPSYVQIRINDHLVTPRWTRKTTAKIVNGVGHDIFWYLRIPVVISRTRMTIMCLKPSRPFSR